jgi:hypothetical protein
MDSTALYGYVPTAWIQICFAVSCLLAVFTTIPSFVKYRNVGLGILVTLGLLGQLGGHVAMAVSAHMPENIPAWTIQFVAFYLGRVFSSLAVAHAFGRLADRHIPYATLNRSATETGRQSRIRLAQPNTFLFFASALILLIPFQVLLLTDRIIMVINPSDPNVGILANPYVAGIFASAIAVCFCLFMVVALVVLVRQTHQAVPWFRVSWMSGYYIGLMTVPVFLLSQGIFLLVKTIVLDYHNEMVELVFDMGMTKAILVFLSIQTYEMAKAWNENPPKELAELVTLYQSRMRRPQRHNHGLWPLRGLEPILEEVGEDQV